jgi:phage gp29-like protein
MAMAEFCNREMSKAILGQTLTTDVYRATGTYSAARVHEAGAAGYRAVGC